MTDIKTLWNAQIVEDNSMITLSELRDRAGRFQAKTHWRNIALYAYSLANIVASIWLIASGRFSFLRYPMLLMIAAHLLVLWQINRRITARALPPEMAGRPALDFHRHELERQASALSRAWLWYIAPFIPPFLWELAIWLQRIQSHTGALPYAAALWLFAFSVLGGLFFWTAVWLAFSRASVRLQLQIERLKAVQAE
jgi:hypothetical protein